MQVILILNSVSFLALFILALILALKSFREKNTQFGAIISVVSVFYIASAILNAVWAFNLSSPSATEAVLAGSAFVMPVAALLCVGFYRLTLDKKFLVFLSIFALSLFGFGMDPLKFVNVIVFVAFFLMLLIGIELSISKNSLWRAGALIACYGATGAAFTFLSIRLQMAPPWFVTSIEMAAAYYFLIQKSEGICEPHEERCQKEPVAFTAVRYFIFILTLLAFLFMSTIAIHEIGHGAAAEILGCESTSVLFSSGMHSNPFTEVSCMNTSRYPPIAVAGIALPLVFGLLLLLSGRGFVRNIGILTISIGLFLSYGDMQALKIPLTYLVLAYLFSFFFIGIAILRICRSYLSNSEAGKKKEQPKKTGQNI
jgi:hypothetical protein